MRIGILEEGKSPPDERVPFTPSQLKSIEKGFNTEVCVQKSQVRRIKDEAYKSAGIELLDDLSECDVLFGVKEVPIDRLIENKTYFFFSHTIKKQPYNQSLLKAVIEKNIRLIDYECLVNERNMRLLGFGRFAGLVGAYNGLRMIGERRAWYVLKKAIDCTDQNDMYNELSKVELEPMKICITGRGRVAKGAIEIMKKIGVKEVSVEAYLSQTFSQSVYVQLAVTDYNRRKDGASGRIVEFFKQPSLYESDFMRFAKVTNYYVACHYWDSNAPFIYTREDLRHPDFNISHVADISCDIDGPVASTIRPSTIKEPFYGVIKKDCSETSFLNTSAVGVMAVDNLPCELPVDASEDFGKQLLDFVIPSLFNEDKEGILERATIVDKGDLTERFEYLRDYLEGN